MSALSEAFAYFIEQVGRKHFPGIPLVQVFPAVMAKPELRAEAIAMLKEWEAKGKPEIRLEEGQWLGVGTQDT